MLITLVIIGVIAALTIPNLMQKYQEQATVKKVQKFYSNLANAYTLVIKDNGPANEWNSSIENPVGIYETIIKPYFKITKDCGVSNTGNCVANVRYKELNNNLTTNFGASTHLYKVTLEDGGVVMTRGHEATSSIDIIVYYDVNGANGPNQYGKDLFMFYIKKDNVFPTGMVGRYGGWYLFNSSCQKTSDGAGCTAWVVYKGNMDYLHCDGLTWQSRSCKEK